MSRYHKVVGASEYAWGYDPPLQEYFLQKFKDNEIVFSIGSNNTIACHPDYPNKLHWSNSEIVDVIEAIHKEEGWRIIPRQHVAAIVLDIPF